MITDEEIREIASGYFHQSGHSLIASGENEGVNIAAELLAFARDLIAANADKCFEAGWIAAAQWADREDLVHDIGSPACLMTKNKALK